MCVFFMINKVSFEGIPHNSYDRNDPIIQQMKFFDPNSNCTCRKSMNTIGILADLDMSDYFKVYEVIELPENAKRVQLKLLYRLSREEYSNAMLMCNVYASLRRGKNQKVVAYSLFGKKPSYYLKLGNLTEQVHRMYPDWIIRIYYDDTIDTSIMCDLECMMLDDKLIDNLDFCNIHMIETNFNGHHLNANYIRKFLDLSISLNANLEALHQ